MTVSSPSASAQLGLACVAGGTCAVSFVSSLMPMLQFVAVCLSIAAAIKALFFTKGK